MVVAGRAAVAVVVALLTLVLVTLVAYRILMGKPKKRDH
jgi:hypothetical protein